MKNDSRQRVDLGDGLWVSVVIATYNRQDLLRRLLQDLDAQTLDPSRYEAVAVDDGSKEDTRQKLADLKTRYAHRIERQENAGAAAARQRGVDLARGKIVVFLDDDMQVKPDFLEKHLEKHLENGDGTNTVVLGRLRPDAKLADMPLFERYYARVMASQGDELASGKRPVRGHNIYTGNVSMARELFDTNVWGSLAVTQAFAPLVIQAKGTIGFVTSIAGHVNVPYMGESAHALHLAGY